MGELTRGSVEMCFHTPFSLRRTPSILGRVQNSVAVQVFKFIS